MKQRAFWTVTALFVSLLAVGAVAKGRSDDRYLTGRPDPFAEMLEFPDWFGDRMDLAGIQEKTRETDKEVVVEMKINGLDKDSLKIEVDDSRIRAAYDAQKREEKKDASGREIFRRESVQHFEKIIPVPADADPRKSRIVKEGDVVKDRLRAAATSLGEDITAVRT